jgi:hypothetical protein
VVDFVGGRVFPDGPHQDRVRVVSVTAEPARSDPMVNLKSGEVVLNAEVRDVLYTSTREYGSLTWVDSNLEPVTLPERYDGFNKHMEDERQFLPDLALGDSERETYIPEGEKLLCLELLWGLKTSHRPYIPI